MGLRSIIYMIGALLTPCTEPKPASLEPSNSSTQTFLTFYFDPQNLVFLSFSFSRKYLRDNERHYLARKVRMRKSL